MADDMKLITVQVLDRLPPVGQAGRVARMSRHHSEPGHDPNIIDVMSTIGMGGSHIWFVVDGRVELVVDLLPALEELGTAAVIKRDTGVTHLRPDEGDWSKVAPPPPPPPSVLPEDVPPSLESEDDLLNP
jgi:hypothetical protein